MTAEEKIVDLLAEGVETLPDLVQALEEAGFDPADAEGIRSDLTEQDFVEVTNLHGSGSPDRGIGSLPLTG